MIQSEVEAILRQVSHRLGFSYPPDVLIEEPPEGFKADLSTNLSLQIAKAEGKNPREVATELKKELEQDEDISQVEIAGPGFLNLNLPDSVFEQVLKALDPDFQLPSKSEKINLEFISANPTGPLHIGNARGGPIGESLARVLKKCGYLVECEFYVNDVGGQVNLFAASVLHFYRQHFKEKSVFPEKGYPGEYVQKLAAQIAREVGERYLRLAEPEQLEAIRQEAISQMVVEIKTTTTRMGITFDTWFFQSSLDQGDLSQKTLERLEHNQATIKKDGAIWLKSGLLEEDRESVLVKSDGSFTYFLDDLSYHLDKFEKRGFGKVIVLLGANHFGHIPRMRAGLKGLGLDPERYQGVIYQYVRLKEDGVTKRMAKREGTMVTADAVLDQVPGEVFTYFLLSKSNDTHLDFDLRLAKDTSEKNPIYYIQYAHARISSLLCQAPKENLQAEAISAELLSREERRLLFHLSRYPAIVKEVATSFKPHHLAQYSYELAARFHYFYAHHRIISADPALTQRLLLLSEKTAATLKNSLHLLGIEAREKM